MLTRLARLEIRASTVETALRLLSERSGVPLSFDASAFVGAGVVTCACTGVTVQEAIKRMRASL